jgi:hypothetical protein
LVKYLLVYLSNKEKHKMDDTQKLRQYRLVLLASFINLPANYIWRI